MAMLMPVDSSLMPADSSRPPLDTARRLREHLPEYAMEALGLGVFMLAAAGFASLLQHPDSPVRQAIASDVARRALMGAAMGLTAIGLIYSPFGTRSGAHINPATTLAFLRLGRVHPVDALAYIGAQFGGGREGPRFAERAAYKEWGAGLSSKAGLPAKLLRTARDFRLPPSPDGLPRDKSPVLLGLFRPYRRIAAGAAGRRNHGCLAGIRRGRADLGIDAGGRAQHAVGFGELVAERLAALAGGLAVRRGAGALLHRRAIRGAIWRRRRGLLRRGRW